MSSIILQPLIQMVLEKLASAIVLENVSSLVNFKKDANTLQNQLLLIQSVVQDTVVSEMEGRLRLIKSVVYDADDFLDALHFKAWQTNKKVSFLSPLIPIPVPFSKESATLKDIRKRLEKIELMLGSASWPRNYIRYRRFVMSERPLTDESQVIGRGEDVDQIIKILLLPTAGSSSVLTRRVSVLPIVARDGFGKTTLAQLIYNHPEVGIYFNLKVWISVGENFNAIKVISDILEYTGKGNANGPQISQLGILRSRLQELLRDKRYLLVLDDVSCGDRAKWILLEDLLCCGIKGSKIVVTTKNEADAQLMGTYPSYNLRPLSDDTCWIMFQQFAFLNGGEEAGPILSDIRSEVVPLCHGSPLAAKLLGSIFRAHRDKREWPDLLQGNRLGCPNNNISKVVSFSLNNLPPYQKSCFFYCLMFPKNYEINRVKLIHQWIAQGLIPSPGDDISYKKMEDTGNNYFNDLVFSSLFEVTSISEQGRIEGIKVHSLIYEIILHHAFMFEPETMESNSAQELFLTLPWDRCATVVGSVYSRKFKVFPPKSIKNFCSFWLIFSYKLRALHLISQGNDFTVNIPSLFKRVRHLRVLNLSNCGITILHKSVGGLKYLRYLDLSNNLIRRLPQTLCNIFNLQTLNLSYCHDLEELPGKFLNLINLRHLNIEGCVSLTQMPPNIGNLRKLQTLSTFIIGPTYEESLFQLVHLDLRGELNIKCLENVKYLLPDLCLEHKQLHSLSLSWGVDNCNTLRDDTKTSDIGHHAEIVLHGLAPNRNLKVLQINEHLGTVFPEWMSRIMLPNLTKLVLVNCRRCETLPTLGQLQFLEILTMQGLDEIVKIADDFYGRDGETRPFPCLKVLSLRDFPNLRSWESVESMEAFPRLQTLSIVNCPGLINMPRFPFLQHLDLHKCNDLILESATELNSLSTLVVNDFQELLFIPRALLQNNSQLTSLTIGSCPKLGLLPATLGVLTALQTLTIRRCKVLENLPSEMRSLTSLETLEIIECTSLNSFRDENIKGLKSLRSLSIKNCLNLASLPITLQNLIALEYLRIVSCPSLQHLPDSIGNLVSLLYLAISDCENIRFLPKGLQRLQALHHLSIIGCPDLELRCHEGTGEDWDKICHIPYACIGSTASQQGQAGASSSSSC